MCEEQILNNSETSEAMSGVAPLRSELVDDPDMLELVDLFVGELPDRIQAIAAALETHDTDSVTRLAHQLKGAGGGYGYPKITEDAAALERAARDGVEPEQLRSCFDALSLTCHRATLTVA